MVRPHVRRRNQRGCLPIGCLAALAAVMVAITVVVILTPVFFRLLPLQYQNGLARRVSLLDNLVLTDTPAPTRSYTADSLPTADSASNSAALRLLATSIPPMTTTSLPTSIVVASPIAATPTEVPLPPTLSLDGYKIIYQGWNNCGPANLAQVMNAYGVTTTQDQTAGWLKPTSLDANVSPWQMNYYVNNHTSMRSIVRYGGTIDLLKQLLNANFRPLVETGFTLPNNPKEGWMGHYLTVAGYDDAQSILYGFDTYLGDGPDHKGRREAYTDLDTRWEQFNRVYIVVYPATREGELMNLLGPDADQTQNLQRALGQAKQDAQTNAQNPFAWFDIGSAETMLHNYQSAVVAFDQSRNTGSGLPWRMLWYQFTPLEAYYGVGDYKTALQLITATLGTTTDVEEMFYWRGMIEAAQGNTKAAVSDFHSTLSFNPNYMYASDALKAVQNGQTPALPDTP